MPPAHLLPALRKCRRVVLVSLEAFVATPRAAPHKQQGLVPCDARDTLLTDSVI
jgi:hypothetical protein